MKHKASACDGVDLLLGRSRAHLAWTFLEELLGLAASWSAALSEEEQRYGLLLTGMYEGSSRHCVLGFTSLQFSLQAIPTSFLIPVLCLGVFYYVR